MLKRGNDKYKYTSSLQNFREWSFRVCLGRLFQSVKVVLSKTSITICFCPYTWLFNYHNFFWSLRPWWFIKAYYSSSIIYFCDWLIDSFIVFNATFSNILAISWWPNLVVEKAGVPGENLRPLVSNELVNFITCGCESSAPFLLFTRSGANPLRIGDRFVWVVR